MFMRRNRALALMVLIFLYMWSGISGCASTSKVKVREEETEPTLEMKQVVREEAVSPPGSVSFEWGESTGLNIAGYNIYYGISSGDYDDSIDVGNYTSITISDFDLGETYYFAVTAYDLDGNESGFSNEVAHTISDDASIDPAQGTIGTEVDITNVSLGEQKPKVLIGESKCKVLTFTPTSVSFLLKKVKKTMGPGTYDVTIIRKGKGVEPIVLPNAFSIMTPSIIYINPVSGFPKDQVTITGWFFGTKKVKAYMGDGIGGKSKKGKVVSLAMDANTGFSTLAILVPTKLAPGLYDVTVTNKVGEDTRVGGFTIQ